MRASVAPWSDGADAPGFVESAGVEQSAAGAGSSSGQSWYEGDWSEDGSQPHGQGTYQWPDGTLLTGAWVNGQAHGTARIERPDGWWFDGEWANGKPIGTGQARKKLKDGSIYMGSVANFMAAGHGTCVSSTSGIGPMACHMGKVKKRCLQQKDSGGTTASGKKGKDLDTASGGGLPLVLDTKMSSRLSPGISLMECPLVPAL